MRARTLAGTAALLVLAGCGPTQTDLATPDIGNAASEAQADINSYAAASNAATFTPPAAPTPVPARRRAQAITPDDALPDDATARSDNAAAR